ncbi:30S ribosomal protein S4 [Candidatus Zinderia endosymbiont of Aphrophora alni]|uniref:30S ribosomal protein S4 n=1 Tax=Candidatus Zinderia endosymbiont of Aphrophora alni TaxID=3077951 RepID=UPI0030CA8BDA
MGRYIGPKCKLSRREEMDLFLKSSKRLLDTKCKLNSKPGGNKKYNKRISDYALQLREKQKIKFIYGILERQFRRYFFKANRMKGNTGQILLMLLESRLDNVVYRMGFSTTRSEARQLISHKTFIVNHNIVNIASYQVKIGDKILVREKFKKQLRIIESLSLAEKNGFPSWLLINKKNFYGTFKMFPKRTEIMNNINESLVVELYSH